MASIHTNSVREELERIKNSFSEQSAAGNVSSESALLIKSLIMLLELVFSIFMEKTTKKNNRNSGLPSSQTGKDDTSKGSGSKGKGKSEHYQRAANARTVTTTVVLPVTQCQCCGESLKEIDTESTERRTRIDILFEKTVEHFDAEIKTCPGCEAVTKGDFPKDIHGPKQYGNGLKAFVIHLMVTQMVAINRVQKMIKTLIGTTLSEATLLSYILRLHLALAPWEENAKKRLCALPCLHTDETSMRVASKNHWIHVYAGDDITLKCLHRARGKAAIQENDIIPRYGGVIVHDCWASYFSYDNCQHGLCGSHLLRELTFVVDSNGYRFAKQMKALLKQACSDVGQSHTKTLSSEDFAKLQKQYRRILTQGEKELPAMPKKPNGKRGRMAKSDAHNLHERLRQHESSVLRFAHDPHVAFTNNRAERDLRMAKVKQKVSGCFRSKQYAEAYCRISSYLQTMANKGVNPLIAIQMALEGNFDMTG